MKFETQGSQQGPPKHAQQIRDVLTVKLFSAKHPAFPEGSMRHLIFNAETNGFKSAFKRCGRRVLVDEAEFFRCLDAVNREGGE